MPSFKYYNQGTGQWENIDTEAIGNGTDRYTTADIKTLKTKTDWVDVREAPFNAKGNGSTIDTVAIKSAITYAESVKKNVYFPSGEYVLDDTLTITLSSIFGDGIGKTKLVFKNINGKNGIVINPVGDNMQISVTDMSVLAKDQNGGTAILTQKFSTLYANRITYKFHNLLIAGYTFPSTGTNVGFETVETWMTGIDVGDGWGADIRDVYGYGNYRIDNTFESQTYKTSTLNILTGCTTSGSITITLNGVETAISLSSTTENTADLVASKIRGTTFTGWTVGGSANMVTFTSTTMGSKSNTIFSGGTTGVTANTTNDYTGSVFIRLNAYGTLLTTRLHTFTAASFYRAIEIGSRNFFQIGSFDIAHVCDGIYQTALDTVDGNGATVLNAYDESKIFKGNINAQRYGVYFRDVNSREIDGVIVRRHRKGIKTVSYDWYGFKLDNCSGVWVNNSHVQPDETDGVWNSAKEVNTLTVTGICTTAENVTVTLDGVSKTVALDVTDNTTTLVATKIRNTTFTGWTTGGTGSTVTFTSVSVGERKDASYSAGTTGATGTMSTTVQGYGAQIGVSIVGGGTVAVNAFHAGVTLDEGIRLENATGVAIDNAMSWQTETTAKLFNLINNARSSTIGQYTLVSTFAGTVFSSDTSVDMSTIDFLRRNYKLESTAPYQWMRETDMGTDAKLWKTYIANGIRGRAVTNDAEAGTINYELVTRSESPTVGVDNIEWRATSFTYHNAPYVKLKGMNLSSAVASSTVPNNSFFLESGTNILKWKDNTGTVRTVNLT